MYISKGVRVKKLPHSQLLVYHYRERHKLNARQAVLWQNGTKDFCQTDTLEEERIVIELARRGLVEITYIITLREKYILLKRCLICVLPKRPSFIRLTHKEKQIMLWLTSAGFRLGISELIFLIENKIEPKKELLYFENAGKLRLLLNGSYITIGNPLDIKASVAYCRDEVVSCVISLIRKKKIYLT